MRHIPNIITSLNLASGFVAIIFAANGELVTASWLILAAMVFDFLDGFSARLLKAYSDIGKELDSLADEVSFGVAPALIIYQLLNYSLSLFNPAMTGRLTGSITIIGLIPVIMPLCGALRLAKFNIDTTQKTSFKGLPIPASALAVISVVIAEHYSGSELFSEFISSPASLLLYTIILSLLMVSRLPLLSLKFANLKWKGNEGKYILVGLTVVAFAVFGISAFPLVIPIYLVSSFITLFFFNNSGHRTQGPGQKKE